MMETFLWDIAYSAYSVNGMGGEVCLYILGAGDIYYGTTLQNFIIYEGENGTKLNDKDMKHEMGGCSSC